MAKGPKVRVQTASAKRGSTLRQPPVCPQPTGNVQRDESRKALRTIGRSGGPFRLSAVQRCSRSSGADNVPSPFTVVARRELSQVAFISIAGRSTRRGYSARFNPKKGSHARASNVPEPCNCGRLRHHPAQCRVFARVSGNVATTAGLHARRLAVVRWANPRCEQDRGLLTAKYSATQRSVPGGFLTSR